MEKLTPTVLKTLAISMLFMLILDTTLIMVETINVHSRMVTLSGIIQNEVARNNCLPEKTADLFDKEIQKIKDRYNIIDSYSHNFTNDLNGRESLHHTQAKDYGSIIDLYITLDMKPLMAVYNGMNKGNSAGVLTRVPIEYTLEYEYQVPALRYIR